MGLTPLQMMLAGITDWITDNGCDPFNVEFVIAPALDAIDNALNCEPETSPRANMFDEVFRLRKKAGIPT
jgi:hypothetical protein